MKKSMRRGLWAVGTAVLWSGPVLMAQEKAAEMGADQAGVYRTVGLGLAAALAVAISIVGAGYAVGRIGSAALGAAAEKPELLTRSILFVALAEGLAVLGFAISMMLLQKI